MLDTVDLSTRSCWLLGRDDRIVDYPLLEDVDAHGVGAGRGPGATKPIPAREASKQHAVLQFRHMEAKNEFGERVGGVRLYLLDLDSANGTTLNGKEIESRRFYEVREGDMLVFGGGNKGIGREYIVMRGRE